MRPVALITGGTRGIGAGIATNLGRDGFTLALAGRRNEKENESFLKSLRDLGNPVRYFQCEIGNPDDRKAMLKKVEEIFGTIDVLVNNAGIAPSQRADILEASEESFEELIGTNLKGPHFLTQAVARLMIRTRPSGESQRCIINIGSVSATVASVNRGDYCISKAGIAMATRLWAVRLAEHGIAVYEVRPGIIQTDMTEGVKEKYDRMIENGLLLERRWGTPEDVGRAVRALARGDIPYATGAVIMIDGGLTVPRL
jgi:3-oxoacyl-[acyl-carrier protein] reductase